MQRTVVTNEEARERREADAEKMVAIYARVKDRARYFDNELPEELDLVDQDNDVLENRTRFKSEMGEAIQ